MGAGGEGATGAHDGRAHVKKNKSLPIMPTAEEQQDLEEQQSEWLFSRCISETTVGSSRQEPPPEKNIMQKLMSGPYAQV